MNDEQLYKLKAQIQRNYAAELYIGVAEKT